MPVNLCIWPDKYDILNMTFFYCYICRDESASATFYFREHTESETKKHVSCEIFKPVSENLEEEWMYYRGLKPGENEFPLRNKQVRKYHSQMLCLSFHEAVQHRASVTVPDYLFNFHI